ncbi:flagellar FlbD family protein [Jeotgalibaca caeni]|uniref:flagellar FlbD family protein n=1 Tax=Jeotgalibaca caeni TaxID=3028623 RepID=UPI00237D743B|nr:flagellar FlbD family protein [Jeotgalibaca caeni]MDE1548276.1 flagellar FlbD family protein [Jeotgalibaca caeni]
MIPLRTVTGKTFYINSDLIYRIDESFDTMITMVNGNTVRVADTAEEINQKIIQYKRTIMCPEREARE